MDSLVTELLISYVGGGVYVNASLSANYTASLDLDGMSPHFHQVAPSGADRQFILPDPSSEIVGMPFLISNTAAAGGYSIPVRGKTILIASPYTLSSASTIGTIAPGVTAYAICRSDGTYYRWSYQSLTPAEALTLTGALTANVVATDTVSEKTSAAGVTIDSVLCKDGSVTVGSGGQLKSDTIAEKTSAAGVTIDGVLCKDNAVTVGSGGSVTTDTIAEKTSAAGVTVDGCLIKDGRAAALATAAMAFSTPQTGTGSPQTWAHGLGATPTLYQIALMDVPVGGAAVSAVSVDATNVTFTLTSGAKVTVMALK